MAILIKQDGVIKAVDLPAVKDAGVWKKVIRGYVKDAGVWKKFVDSEQFVCQLELVAGLIEINIDAPCVAVIGDEVKHITSVDQIVVDRECKAWLVVDGVATSVCLAGDALKRVVTWDGVVGALALSSRAMPSVNLEQVPEQLVKGVEDLTECFVDCAAMAFGIGGWDVSDVKQFDSMLEGSGFAEDLSGWDVGSAESYNAFADRSLMLPEWLPPFV